MKKNTQQLKQRREPTISDVLDAMNIMAKGIDKRFDQVDKRFLDLESRMDSRFVDLEDRMNHKFDLMENQIDSLAKQTKDIYDEQRSLVKLYTYLYDKVEIHDRAILSLKSKRG